MEEVEIVVLFMMLFCCANAIFTGMLEKRLAYVEKEIEYAAKARSERRRELLLRIMELDLRLARAKVKHHRRRRKVILKLG